MQRSAGQRTAAILLAIVAQGSFVALIVLPRGQEAEEQPETPGLVFVQPLDMLPVLRPPLTPRRSARTSGISSAPAISPVPETDGSERSNLPEPRVANTITLTPPEAPRIDWQQGLATALQEIAGELADKERGNPLDSKPDVLELPKVPAPTPDLRMDRLPGGDVITRHRLTEDLEMVCEHIQKPLMAKHDVTWNRLPFCSTYRTRTGLEGIDKLKPGYISRPVPKPRPAKAAGKVDLPTDALP